MIYLELKETIKKKIDWDSSRMLCNDLKTSWKQQQPTKQQLYDHLLPKLSKLDEQDLLDTTGKERTHKPHSHVDSYTWPYQCWLTIGTLHSSVLGAVWKICQSWILIWRYPLTYRCSCGNRSLGTKITGYAPGT